LLLFSDILGFFFFFSFIVLLLVIDFTL